MVSEVSALFWRWFALYVRCHIMIVVERDGTALEFNTFTTPTIAKNKLP
jgi:hypothetical protein